MPVGLSVVALVLAGCGSESGGVSEYDQMKAVEKDAETALQSKGIKMEPRRLPQGDSWAVDLSGQDITDDTLDVVAWHVAVKQIEL